MRYVAGVVAILFSLMNGYATETSPSGMTEKAVTDISSLAGKWKGSMSSGSSLVTTFDREGSYTSVVAGATYHGKAEISDGKVIVRSHSTGISYILHIYESPAQQRVMVWLNESTGARVGTAEFVGTR
jgi:hypothetical protein